MTQTMPGRELTRRRGGAISAGPHASTRDPFVDAVRVGAVVVVVAGHAITTTVIWEPGRIAAENALSAIPEAHVITWLLQVMPLLFFVGGFSNARAWARYEGDYLAFLRSRLRRLLTPTVAFIVTWLVVAGGAALLPLPEPNVVARAADLAALPFWFLGLYVVVVAIAPSMLRMHRRLGWWAPAALVAGAVAVDVLVHGLGWEATGVANYAFVWLLPHQLGFFYADGRLERLTGAAAGGLAAMGLAGLTVAVTVGGYPMSMVGVPGADRWNTDPPSLALIALTTWLVGLILLARPVIEGWARRRAAQVQRLNAVTLTTYLWHVSAIALAAAVLYPLGFPRPETGSPLWWAMRPLWLVAVAPVLVLLVRLFRRFEVHPDHRGTPGVAPLSDQYVTAGFAVASLALGILGFGVTGFDQPATPVGETVLAFTLNPLQSVVHVSVGLALLRSVFAPRPALFGVIGASFSYLLLGTAGWSDGLRLFATNPAVARLHVGLGTLGLALLVLARFGNRRRTSLRLPTVPPPVPRPNE